MKQLKGRFLVGTGVVMAAMALLAFGLASPDVSLGEGTDVGTPGETLTVTLEADKENPEAGESVVLTLQVVDTDGSAVGNTDCTLSITSQPGTDASLDSATGTTDASGSVSATLDTGSTAGDIVVEADCGGNTATATVSVVAGAAAEPPGSLPQTGTGGFTDSGGSMNVLLFALVATLGAALAGAGLIARRQNSGVKEG